MLNRFGILTGSILAATFVVDLFVPLGYAIWVGYLFAVTASRYWAGTRGIVVTACAASVLMVLDLWLGVPGSVRAAVLNKTLGLTLIGLSAWISQLQHRAEEKQGELVGQLQQALQEIKTLHGVLPICSFCKKIRLEDGEWEQLEAYVSAHSDATFSHGCCGPCAQKHYPDVFPLRQ